MDPAEILSKLQASLEKGEFSEKAIATMTETFRDSIKEVDQKYREDLAKAEADKKEADGKLAEMQKSLAENTEKLATAQKELDELKKIQEEAVANATFQTRMGELDGMFTLEDADRKVISDELKAVASDEAYEAYKGRLSILLAGKAKAAGKENEEETVEQKVDALVQKKLAEIAKASEGQGGEGEGEGKGGDDELGIKETLKALREKANASFPNSISDEDRTTLQSKFSKAFSEKTVKISL